MDKIKWCAGKREGLRLVEPNSNLAEAYIRKAEEALESMQLNLTRDWKISTAYYTIYFSLYAVLTKIGIKCEIHSCTIEFAKRFLKEFFSGEEMDFAEDSLKARIDSQYYVDRTIPDEQYDEIVRNAPEFFVKCHAVLIKLNENKIGEIRKKFLKEANIAPSKN
ncbi:MAG: HEPN domain-containing protein [Candidatus Woesearchaeota archaeon]|nr:HEPN domain-containing protein [Candidatus Woesearchaeota archaeon]